MLDLPSAFFCKSRTLLLTQLGLCGLFAPKDQIVSYDLSLKPLLGLMLKSLLGQFLKMG
jgi:hypothetical protein